MRPLQKLRRFVWRAGRNAICAVPGGAGLLFPAAALAQRFGRGDAEYALRVYQHHAAQLEAVAFGGRAQAVLEVGPGRNLGSALLWWCRAVAQGISDSSVTLWDVYPNADPHAAGYWPSLAAALVRQLDSGSASAETFDPAICAVLAEVASTRRLPRIAYHVCPMEDLAGRLDGTRFDLIYSQAALEHVWNIAALWALAMSLTAPGGWHSHRIDLADHGRRESNFVEMLEWSPWAWWATNRFVPGAINRWRAAEHLAAVEKLGLQVSSARRELRAALPVRRSDLAKRYRDLDEHELLTSAIDIVGRLNEAACARFTFHAGSQI